MAKDIFTRFQMQTDDAKALLDALIKIGGELGSHPLLTQSQRQAFSELESALDEQLPS